MAERLFNLCGLIPRSLPRKNYSQTSKSLSFPNVSIGNPDETVTCLRAAHRQAGPPIKTFGGDDFGINSHQCFLILIVDLLSRGYGVRFRAAGKSMYPTIEEGEMITVEPLTASDVKVADIILYRNRRFALIAHRVVDITQSFPLNPRSSSLHHQSSFILRGDASTSCDNRVEPQQILGKVVSVERDGRRVDLGSKGAKMLYRARLWTSRLRRAISHLRTVNRGWMIEDRGWRSSTPDPRSSILDPLSSSLRLLLLAGLLLFVVWPTQVQAQGIGFDAASSSSTTDATSLTFSHTVSGSNRLLIVGVSITDDVTTVSGVTYAGTALTLVGTVSNPGVARAEIWRLVAPATGANNVVVTVAAAADFIAGAASFTGVHQTTPLGSFFSATGNSATPSVNVTGVNEGEAVIDTLNVENGPTATVGAGQTQRWNVAGDSTGAGSTEPGPDGGGTVTMSWSVAANLWAIGAVAIKPSNPTAVRLMSFSANAYDDRVLLRWRTGYEMDNLGFNVYREEGGYLIRVTSSLVAGSALLAAGRTALTAGRSYSWWDNSIPDPQSSILNPRSSSVRYWLEDVDLNGQRTWHGPVEVQWSAAGDRLTAWEQGMLLNRLGSQALGVRGRGTQSSALSTQSSRHGRQNWIGRLAGHEKARNPLEVQWALAAGPAVKILIQENGWYRLRQPELVAAGLDPRVDPRLLQLFVDGEEQAIVVVGERDGRFDPEDGIEFYGVGLDTPSTDTRVYWLVLGSRPGKRIKMVQGQGGQAISQSFPLTAEWKPRTIYFAALRNGEAENFFGPLISMEPLEQALTVHHLDPNASGEALLEVVLQGVTNVTHQVRINLNGVDVGSVVFNGQERGIAKIPISQAGLRNGENLVTLVAGGGEMDVSLVDVIRLTYWHTLRADQDTLWFTVPGNHQVTVGGFTSASIRVVDITNPKAVREVEARVAPQDGGFAATLRVSGPGQRTLLAFTPAQARRPEEVIANQPSAWHQGGLRADYVIITHGDFLQSVEPLRALRDGQGRTVAVIDVEDLYDEFNFGAKSPRALRDFLKRAKDHWQRSPRFVLLVGDASVDPRNYLGFGDFDFLPTKLVDTSFLETASDDWFVDFNGDGLPEMAVGRLPVRTAEEAATMVSKIIGYEQSGGGGREALLVADNNDIFDFETASTKLNALLLANMTVHEVFRGRTDVETARREILDRINQGQMIVNYMGHGSVEVWAGEGLLTSADARALRNGKRLSFFVSMTCLNGLFHDVFTESLAEALMKAENGGAVAVWAPSGATVPAGQAVMNQELFRLLFGGKSLTIGETVVGARAAVTDTDVRRTWILFGDPATRIR